MLAEQYTRRLQIDRIDADRKPLIWLAVTAACVLLLLLRTPSPEDHLVDGDHGQQLAGAQQIAAGEHPFVDFRTTYGPLSYYASAAAQALAGNRLAGEFALDITGYLIAYVCLFAVARRLTNRDWLAFLWTMIAIALAPPMYKYYIAAGPLAVMLASLRYMERASMARLAVIAGTVAASGLFRADYGVFTALAAGTAVALAQPKADRPYALMTAAGLVVAWASPWLVFAGIEGGLGEYLRSSTIGNVSHAGGLTLPLPTPDFENLRSHANPLFVSFVYFWMLPSASVAIAFVVGLRGARGSGTDNRAQVVVAAVLTQLTLLQSVHRADALHLLEAIPAALALAAWLSAQAIDALRSAATTRRMAGAAVLAATLVSLRAATELQSAEFMSPTALVSAWRVYGQPREEAVKLVRTRQPGNWQARTIEYIRSCTLPAERILALPLLTSYYHLSERLFAGGYMYVFPGFFVGDDEQRKTIAIMKSQDVPVIVDLPSFVLDGRDDRRTERIAPILAQYLDEAYAEAGRIGDARIRIRRDRLPGGAPGDGEPRCPLHVGGAPQ